MAVDGAYSVCVARGRDFDQLQASDARRTLFLMALRVLRRVSGKALTTSWFPTGSESAAYKALEKWQLGRVVAAAFASKFYNFEGKVEDDEWRTSTREDPWATLRFLGGRSMPLPISMDWS